MSNYEKRQVIFKYICENGSYDFDKLQSIKNRGSRDLFDDLYSALDERPSICNGFSQYYKLLLEKVGIYSLCVICDDGTDVNHQLNLVRNDDGTYSFDDVTSVIVGRGSVIDFFDYDLECADVFNQGKRPVSDGCYWFLLPTSYVYFLIDKNDSSYLKYGMESDSGDISFPANIKIYKTKIVQCKSM